MSSTGMEQPDKVQEQVRTSWAPALLLMLLSPSMAELVSSSSPPLEFFQPFTIIFIIIGYGFAAVLLRELAVRHDLGLWPKLLLSLSMGLAIEGVICKSFFSPEWPDFSFPLGYDRLWGVNWCWALLLLAYHAVQSFLLPWLATDLLLPQYRRTACLSRRALGWLATLWVLAGLFGFLLFPMNQATKVIYHPGPLATLFAWGGLLALPWLAMQLDRYIKARAAAGHPAGRPTFSAAKLISPRQLGWLTALAFPLLLFILPAIIVETLQWPAWALFGTLLVFLGAVLLLVRLLQGRLSPQHSFALLAGTQGFWVIGGLIAQLDNAKRPDDTTGMWLVAALLLAGLLCFAQLLKRRSGRLTATPLGAA